MQDKLQELTDKLYNAGLSKGKEEGEQILEDAKLKAAAILKDAKAEAAAIVEKAHKEAEDYKVKIESDLKMASAQTLQATRKDVENLVISKIADEKVEAALKDADFIKEMLKAVATKFNSEEAVDLDVVLPETLKDNLEPFIKTELAAALKGTLEASFTKKVAGGFNIGPKDGGYFISLTDDSFKSLIGEYLRPVTKKLLFG